MLDPSNITNFNRTDSQLQEFLLFGICVAGKSSDVQAKKLNEFLSFLPGRTPFEKIRRASKSGVLEEKMREVKLGKYYLLVSGFEELAFSNINLSTCSRKELESFTGIGPKTSRFFILHSREDSNVACLDVHILRWLRDLGYNTPNSTPSGNQYKRLEQTFLREARERDAHPAELDLNVWNYYSGKETELVM